MMKNQLLCSLLLGAVFFCSIPVGQAQAANVSFGQSILPVRFVYLDKQGGIKNIWSNVSVNDKAYVVKFFDDKTKKEVSRNEKLLGEYQKSIVRKEEQIFPDKELFAKTDKKIQLSIDFIKKDNSLEEVQTIV